MVAPTRAKTQATLMWEEFSMIAIPTEAKRTATFGTGRRKTEVVNNRLRRLPLAAASTPWPGMDKQTPVAAREYQDALPPECCFG